MSFDFEVRVLGFVDGFLVVVMVRDGVEVFGLNN